jgi:tetratricopeptide (TPR) repeat protein
MGTRDLLLLIGFLRSGKMFPAVHAMKGASSQRSLRLLHDAMEERERELFGSSRRTGDEDDFKRRAALTSWSGDVLPAGTRVAEVPDPGVVLCLLYDVPAVDAPLPVDVFAQTLRRYALRDPALRARFREHVDTAGTYVPAWLSPEVRRQMSQDAFDGAMKVAREQGFAQAAPLFEGVRGECFAKAQVAIAVFELRELAESESALRRLTEVVRVAPRNVAARMQRAALLRRDPSRKVDAAADYLAVLRVQSRAEDDGSAPEVREAATTGLWALHADFHDAAELEQARALARYDLERGFEALSRYVQTHPCAWDAQAHLASLALATQRFDLAAKLLAHVRWLFPDDPNPHYVYGQAVASTGALERALPALEHAAQLAPDDLDVQQWLGFVRRQVDAERGEGARAASVIVAHHVARSLLLVLGIVRGDRVYPSVTPLNKLPGDVALSLVLRAVASQERRRFGPVARVPLSTAEIDLRTVADRCVVMDYAGEELSTELTVGDVADPGVVLVLLYEASPRDELGRAAFEPSPMECRGALLSMVQIDMDMSGKLERHLRSADASLKARLDEA